MVGDYLRHHQGNFVGCIKLTGFLSGISREVADKVFVYKTENVIVLTVIGWNILNQIEQILNRLGLCAGTFTEFAQAVLQSIENTLVNLLMSRIYKTGKSSKSISHISDREVPIRFNPS